DVLPAERDVIPAQPILFCPELSRGGSGYCRRRMRGIPADVATPARADLSGQDRRRDSAARASRRTPRRQPPAPLLDRAREWQPLRAGGLLPLRRGHALSPHVPAVRAVRIPQAPSRPALMRVRYIATSRREFHSR